MFAEIKLETMRKLKQSINQYRNIQGKFYIFDTADLDLMKEVKKECKSKGFSYRMIDGQLFVEVKDGKIYNGTKL